MPEYDLKNLLKGMPRGGRLCADVTVTFGRARNLRPDGPREWLGKLLRALADCLDAHESIVMAVTGDVSPEAVRESWAAGHAAFVDAVRQSARIEISDRQIGEAHNGQR